MFNFGPSCVLLTALQFGPGKQGSGTRPFVRSRMTTVVIEHLLSMHGFAVHLGAQALVCCACDAYIAFDIKVLRNNFIILLGSVCFYSPYKYVSFAAYFYLHIYLYL